MLTERQKTILKIIIDDYINSAEPVGSRTIAKNKAVKFSPATIRNEMADLEDLGFLIQPHTSAGRIPSQKAYRYYVDNLMEKTHLSESSFLDIRDILFRKKLEIEDIMSSTASILSDLTNYTAIALGPEVFQTVVRNIQLLALNQTTCLCILVTDTGHVEKKIVTIPDNLPVSELEKMTNILNSRLSGTPLYKVANALFTEVAEEFRKYTNYYEQSLEFLEKLLLIDGSADRRGVFLKGTSHILSQPEFKDIDNVKKLLTLLEESGQVVDLFNSRSFKTEVKIGSENLVSEAENCSVFTANYTINGQAIGSIGIIGPTRIDYAKIISLIDYVSDDLSKVFKILYNE